MKTIEKWQIEESKLVLDEPWARVRHDVCKRPDGSTIDDYYYWEGGDFVKVFALTPDGQVIVVRQYKHGVKEVVVELPGGLIRGDDATPTETARRFLLEEGGCVPAEWQLLSTLHVSSAKSTACAHVFLALGTRRVQMPQFDNNVNIEVETCSVQEFMALAASGAIKDAHSLAAAMLAIAKIS